MLDFNSIITTFGPVGVIIPASAWIIMLLVNSVTKTNSAATASLNSMVVFAGSQTTALNIAQAQLIILEKEKTAWTSEKVELLNRIDLLQYKIKELSFELGRNDAKLKKLEVVEKELDNLKLEMTRVKSESNSVKDERDALRLQLAEYKSRIELIEKNIDSIESDDKSEDTGKG